MSLRSLKFYKIVFAAACVFLMFPNSCSREPHYSPIPLNQPMLLLPSSVNETGSVNKVIQDLGGVHLTSYWEGASIGTEDSAAKIKFYRNNQAQAYYETTWTQLKSDYRASGCKSDQISTLDGPLDAALICDGRLGKLSEITKVEVVSPKEGETKSTSTFSSYQRGEDVTAVMVQLY